MLPALVLAACTVLVTCNEPPVPPCATPTPTLMWDAVADTPNATIAGYKVYARFPGGTFQLALDLPCWLEDDGTRRCRGVDIAYPVQRVSTAQLADVEWTVRAYDTQGDVSLLDSNVVSVCMPKLWTGGPYN